MLAELIASGLVVIAVLFQKLPETARLKNWLGD
jgi:hypothetical protein